MSAWPWLLDTHPPFVTGPIALPYFSGVLIITAPVSHRWLLSCVGELRASCFHTYVEDFFLGQNIKKSIVFKFFKIKVMELCVGAGRVHPNSEQRVNLGIQLFRLFGRGLALGCMGQNVASYYTWGDQVFLRKTSLQNV